jgi:hypothetical protein
LSKYFQANPRDKAQKKDHDIPVSWDHTTTTSKAIQEGPGEQVVPLDQIPELVDDQEAARPTAKNKSKKQARYLEKIPVDWTQEMVKSWEFSRTWLSQEPVLVSYCPGYPVVITVDSLLIAQNGIVEQYQRSRHLLVLAYYSRKVVGTKKMWAAAMLELDGLCWILKKAADFIENQTFLVINDHRAIQYILGYHQRNPRLSLVSFT